MREPVIRLLLEKSADYIMKTSRRPRERAKSIVNCMNALRAPNACHCTQSRRDAKREGFGSFFASLRLCLTQKSTSGTPSQKLRPGKVHDRLTKLQNPNSELPTSNFQPQTTNLKLQTSNSQTSKGLTQLRPTSFGVWRLKFRESLLTPDLTSSGIAIA